jgi:transglutaminase-like putative cysteine protease
VVRTASAVLFLAALPGSPGGARPSRAVPAQVSDSIYSLAVDSAEYPRDAYVFLLDDGVIRYEADGRGSRTYRQVVQILKEDAVERWAEHSFGYQPGRERLTVNWIRVVSLTGQIISDKPGITQDADVPAPMGDPSYAERKVRRMSLPNVRPGTLVDYSYTIEEFKPFRPGDFFTGWRVSPGTLVRRSRLVLDTPVSLTSRVMARNLDFRPDTLIAAGRRVVTWAKQDVPKIEPEPFAADSNDVDQTITIAGPGVWRDVGAWYAGLARDRYAVTPAVAEKLALVVSGARTLEDSVKAVHRYVAKDVRYVAIALGMGGYQPRSVADVVATGYGDCKDKATLFIALAARLGVTAIRCCPAGGVEKWLPSIYQFNHAIAAVERPRPPLRRSTAGMSLGRAPTADHDRFILVVHPDSRTEEDEPRQKARTPRNDLVVDAVPSASSRRPGRAGGHHPGGQPARDMFSTTMDRAGDSFGRLPATSFRKPGGQSTTIDQLDEGGASAAISGPNGRAAQRRSGGDPDPPQAASSATKPLIASSPAPVYPIDVRQVSRDRAPFVPHQVVKLEGRAAERRRVERAVRGPHHPLFAGGSDALGVGRTPRARQCFPEARCKTWWRGWRALRRRSVKLVRSSFPGRADGCPLTETRSRPVSLAWRRARSAASISSRIPIACSG